MKNFNMDKSIDLLDFVQDCQKLFSTQNDIVTNDTNWKCYQDNLTTRKELLVQIFQKYFHEESPSTITLGNSVLRDDIYQQLKSITKHEYFLTLAFFSCWISHPTYTPPHIPKVTL